MLIDSEGAGCDEKRQSSQPGSRESTGRTRLRHTWRGDPAHVSGEQLRRIATLPSRPVLNFQQAEIDKTAGRVVQHAGPGLSIAQFYYSLSSCKNSASAWTSCPDTHSASS